MDIIKGLGNANKIMNRLLFDGYEKYGLGISEINGGSLRNAIPRESFAKLCIDNNKRALFLEEKKLLIRDIKNEFLTIEENLKIEIKEIKDSGRYKNERIITSPQRSVINTTDNKVVNFCANNYLGLASDTRIINAAKESLDTHGFGLASVRFICGTQDIHKELEEKISNFLETEDTILYAAAFDANGGLFEPLFNHNDAIISDSLNHASIIDGIRLCKAARFRYNNNDMVDLENKLKEASNYRNRVIVTDGVFSMDGTIAKLDLIYELAKNIIHWYLLTIVMQLDLLEQMVKELKKSSM
jgi:hypothetical protein